MASKKKSAEVLVAEQKGGRKFWTGFLISVFLGFALRAYLSPQNIHRYLVKATQSIGSEVQVSWSSASLVLREGFFLPRFALQIENFQMISVDSCVGQPILYTKLLQVPIHVFDWVAEGRPLKTLLLNDSFLEFRTPLECQEKSVSKVERVENSGTGKAVRLKAKEELQGRPPVVLEQFLFKNLKVRHPQIVPADVVVTTLNVTVRDNQPWYVTVTSQFPMPETDGVDSKIDLNVVYKEFPTAQLEAAIKGHWREGSFETKGLWKPTEKNWKMSAQFNHFPLQFLKMIAAKAKTPWNWPDRPTWFSFLLEAEGAGTGYERPQLLLRDIRLEGDLGELKVPDLRVVELKPLRVDPFVFQADQVRLDDVFARELKRWPLLESLGILSGQGQWIAQNEFRFSGEFDKIKLHSPQWLSQQPVWTVKVSQMTAHLKKGRWDFSARNLVLDDQIVDGEVTISGDQDLKNGKLKSNLKIKKMPYDIIPAMDSLKAENIDLSMTAGWKPNSSLLWNVDYRIESLKNEMAHFSRYKGKISSKKEGWELRSQNVDGTLLKPLSFMRNWSFDGLTWPLELGEAQHNLISKNRELSWKWSSAPLDLDGTARANEEIQGRLKLLNKNYRYSKALSEDAVTLLPN